MGLKFSKVAVPFFILTSNVRKVQISPHPHHICFLIAVLVYENVRNGMSQCFFFVCFVLAVLGLCCCTRASSCEQGLLFFGGHKLLVVGASLAEHRL